MLGKTECKARCSNTSRNMLDAPWRLCVLNTTDPTDSPKKSALADIHSLSLLHDVQFIHIGSKRLFASLPTRPS